MGILENLNYLFDLEEVIPCEDFQPLDDLVAFTLEENGKLNGITKINNSNYEYNFHYKNKIYPFSFFSNRKLQEFDIKMLKIKEERERLSLIRTLKLASSMDLVNPKVIVGKSNYDELVYLLSFFENGKEKIVDYSKNLVMNKDNYFELFELSVFNELDKYDLYRIDNFVEESDCYELQNLFFLFSEEMFRDLGRNYPYFTAKYGTDGINMRNYTIFSDSLFSNPKYDNINQPFYATRERIDAFTLNPKEENENICYDEEKKRYIYFDEEFGGFLFRLFSDLVVPEEKKKLLSDERYHECHENAAIYTIALSNKYASFIHMISVVSGKVKRNELDFYYHSWIELKINGSDVVIDYNHNLMMPKEEYYKLYCVEVISKTSYFELKENLDFLKKIWGSKFSLCTFNYFGNDFTRDLKRNLHLFKKSE